VYVLVEVMAPVDVEPEVALLPDHAPLAVHPVALPEDQVSVLEPPEVTLVGTALIVTVGTGRTVTVADCACELPPVPAQVSVKVLVAESAPVDTEPAVASLPDHAPLAVHPVALVEDHVSVLEPPEPMLAGLALIVTVGAGRTVTVADCGCEVPPVPVQVSV
jgi:hypothetical protein